MNLLKKISKKIIKIKNRLIYSWLEKKYHNRKVLRQTSVNGCQMLVLLSDKIGRQIIASGEYEAEDSDFLSKQIRPDWISLDIGANIGCYSLLLAKLAPAGRVFAFEPSDFNFHLLHLNRALNDLGNLEIINLALADKNGEQEFCVAEDSCFSSFRNTCRKKISQVVNVKTETLDNFVRRSGIAKINFIKIDVEGAEKLVLQGASDVLARLKPEMIMVEICEENLAAFNENGKNILAIMEKFAYRPFVISSGKLISFSGDSFGRSSNIYFLPSQEKPS
jgi:FkbM family methyltransferase